ncbi:hypothetical protein BB558_004155 [Smittium angustum]|uniref:Uncharacterized protein n=1 Tax=Smittium angustum TaxID=133377 RepID=A0A2U1J483_SMIAN|nr:hypothetical protein BB558_006975 [Smittium angustum]PVZ99818.1 hypothetical protein BB558_004155 [Smittium angustum]
MVSLSQQTCYMMMLVVEASSDVASEWTVEIVKRKVVALARHVDFALMTLDKDEKLGVYKQASKMFKKRVGKLVLENGANLLGKRVGEGTVAEPQSGAKSESVPADKEQSGKQREFGVLAHELSPN